MAGPNCAGLRRNGDRLADVVVSVFGGGLAVVYGGRSHTTMPLSALTPGEGFFTRPDSGEIVSVAVAGDMNADGHDDLLALSSGEQIAAYLLFAP